MRLQRWTDFELYNVSVDAPAAVREQAFETAVETINTKGVEAFLAAHPEYHPCPENSELLEAWIYLHGDGPLTRLNLELAQRELADDLKPMPPPEPVEVDRWAGVTRIENLQAVWEPDDAEREALAKVADDPNLNDHQRKVRLKKLALLAGKQRREFSDLPSRPTKHYPEGADPKIAI